MISTIFLLLMLGILFAQSGTTEKLRSHYELLSIDRSSSIADVKKAYRKLSFKLHPDRHAGSSEERQLKASQEFAAIVEAYEILADPLSRRYYDIYGSDHKAMQIYFEEMVLPYRAMELYANSENVQILYDKNISEKLKLSPLRWVVTFYHPNCGSCRSLVTTLEEVAVKAKDKLKCGAVNCSVQPNLCHKFGIRNYGIIYIFFENQEDSGSPGFWEYILYTGSMNTKDIITSALEKSALNQYLNEEALMTAIVNSAWKGRKKQFPKVYIVQFYKPRCSPCRQLRRELQEVSKELEEFVEFGAINCSSQNCRVPHYPFLKLYVQRAEKQTPEVTVMPFRDEGHPGSIAAQWMGFFLKVIYKENVLNFKEEL